MSTRGGGSGMLELVETYLARIRGAEEPHAIIDILGDLSRSLGFRSGILLEYTPGQTELVYILDSNAARGEWWEDYVKRGLRDRVAMYSEALRGESLVRMRADRFSGPDDPVLLYLKDYDLIDCIAVPVVQQGEVVGAAVFSGDAPLNDMQQMALQLIVYNLFAQVRSINGRGIIAPKASLTPREKQVLNLVAEGMTSAAIATDLGLSARTVNQHIENVATKLGTRNRVQTAAEAIRFGLLK